MVFTIADEADQNMVALLEKTPGEVGIFTDATDADTLHLYEHLRVIFDDAKWAMRGSAVTGELPAAAKGITLIVSGNGGPHRAAVRQAFGEAGLEYDEFKIASHRAFDDDFLTIYVTKPRPTVRKSRAATEEAAKRRPAPKKRAAQAGPPVASDERPSAAPDRIFRR